MAGSTATPFHALPNADHQPRLVACNKKNGHDVEYRAQVSVVTLFERTMTEPDPEAMDYNEQRSLT